MPTPAQQAQTRDQIAQRVPGEKSSLPAIVLLAGWLIPGAGHMILGKWVRGVLLFAAIVTMYAIGLALAGKIYNPATGDILDILGSVAQLGTGLLYLLARVAGWGTAPVLTTVADYGSKALLIAGLLNIIAAVDAYSLANGRKAS
jgi:TM2 domain-containing membrane protein YozV